MVNLPGFVGRFLSTGDAMTMIHFSYRISHSSVREIIFETCQAIWKQLVTRVMQPPDETRWIQISDGFDAKWQFPNCIGALDGKHVDIQAPPAQVQCSSTIWVHLALY